MENSSTEGGGAVRVTELVSGWSDEERVYLIERDGDSVRYRSVPARWSMFVLGMDEKDRATLARSSNVIAIIPEGQYTRIDCRGKWQRREVAEWLGKAIEERRTIGWKDPNDATPEPALLEADVMPLRRLLSDNGHLQVSANPRLVWLDLEVDPRGSFQEMIEGRRRILVWALYRWDGEKEVKVASDVLKADSDDAEREFLGALFDQLLAFDVVLSWNGQDFDFPCLENRSMKLRVKMPNSGKVPIWQRWCWLDHMEVYEKYNQAHESGEERASVSLDSVSKHLLGKGKLDFNAREGWEAWLAGGERRARFVAYCEHDTALMPQIEKASGFVALHLAVCHVTRCFPDTFSLQGIEQGDGYLLRLGAERGYRFPTKVFRQDDTVQQFSGAYVMPPKMLGAIDQVSVCDFAGLYPSIMRSWNMSPDTMVPKHRVEVWGPEKCRLPTREVFFRTDERGIFPTALDTIVAKRGEYTKLADAAEPGSPEQDYYKRLSSAFKIVANSFYGIIGAPRARYYDPILAEGVTKTAEFMIKHVAATLEKAGLKPFYGDTDSVFAQGLRELFAQVINSLNTSWPGMLGSYGCKQSFVKLEFEKGFARLILKSAKCYAGRYDIYKGKPYPADKKPEVRGLEYKRGDVLRFARQMQFEAIMRLLPPVLPMPPIPSVEEFREWVQSWRTKVLEGKLELGDVVLSKSVKGLSEYAVRYTSDKCTNKVGTGKAARSCGYLFPGGKEVGDGYPEECPKCTTKRKQVSPPVHVRVAKLLAERGEQMTPGTRVEYLVVQGEGLEGESDGEKMNAVPANDPGVMERLDRDYYWDRLVFPATQRLLEAAYPGEDWKDTKNTRKKAEVAAEREAKKYVFTDLPLFGAPPDEGLSESTRVDSPAAVEPLAAAPAPETAPTKGHIRPRRAVRAAPETQEPVVLRIEVPSAEEYLEEKSTRLLEAIGAAVSAHPGECPVVVEVVIAEPASVVRVKTELKVKRSQEAISALQRLTGPGGITSVR